MLCPFGMTSRLPRVAPGLLMREHAAMHDENEIAEVVLARLHLGAFRDGPVTRAWKGARRARELFERHSAP